MIALSSRRFPRFSAIAAAVLFVSLFLLAFSSGFVLQRFRRPMDLGSVASNGFQPGRPSTRKLLEQGERGGESTNRIAEGCSKEDITVYQGATSPLPSGIPTYTVEVLNLCSSGCAMGDIHFSCGWFSSARLVNPRVFRRLSYDDCLVNDGRPLRPGATLSFQYANSFRYRLAVSNASCS